MNHAEEIKKYNRSKNGKDDLLEIHLEMSKVIGRIKEIQEDRKWEVYELALPETTMVRR